MNNDTWVILGFITSLLAVQTTVLVYYINAKTDGLRQVMEAKFETVNAQFDTVNSKIDALRRDVDRLYEHLSGDKTS